MRTHAGELLLAAREGMEQQDECWVSWTELPVGAGRLHCLFIMSSSSALSLWLPQSRRTSLISFCWKPMSLN